MEAKAAALTVEDLPKLLENDNSVKVGGTDIDGIIRGKLMSKKKFLSVAQDGFGFCSVIFGWDMHDQTYFQELKISNQENGYRDILAVVDLTTFRRIPWENNVPFFLLSFREPGGQPLAACPRSLLTTAAQRFRDKGIEALAGAEYEFYQFRAPSIPGVERSSSSTVTFLRDNPIDKLPTLDEGMFGYSLTRPGHNQDYYYDVFNSCEQLQVPIEGWHTESGPGVYEAALAYSKIEEMADRAVLFKLATKNIGSKYGISPCFMAKPKSDLPGCSGHVHVSLCDKDGQNLFARDEIDPNPEYPDLAGLSELGQYFLAGLLDGLPDVMPIVAPTINSYKRFSVRHWAPVEVSWGLEHRAASIRLIAPPTSSAKATRFEVRVPGADTNPYLVFAAILALGLRGIEKKLKIPIPPLRKSENAVGTKGMPLARSLREATECFKRPGSIAREVFGDDFVDHFAGTREHELHLFESTVVTDWEFKRYIETV